MMCMYMMPCASFKPLKHFKIILQVQSISYDIIDHQNKRK